MAPRGSAAVGPLTCYPTFLVTCCGRSSSTCRYIIILILQTAAAPPSTASRIIRISPGSCHHAPQPSVSRGAYFGHAPISTKGQTSYSEYALLQQWYTLGTFGACLVKPQSAPTHPAPALQRPRAPPGLWSACLHLQRRVFTLCPLSATAEQSCPINVRKIQLVSTFCSTECCVSIPTLSY